MPTISGKYKFNSTLSQLAEGEYPVTFTSNGGTFAKFAVEGLNFYYLTASNNGVNAYLFGVNFWNSGEAYRDIDFGSTPQTISDTLYNYLVANAAKEETQTTFDLSTLNLAAGTYRITVKAKAEGYRESDASNAVTYTVAPTVTFTRVYLTWANNESTLSNMNKSKVYTVNPSWGNICNFSWNGSAWVASDLTDGVIDSQTDTSVTFHIGSDTKYKYNKMSYVALEGNTAAPITELDKYTLSGNECAIWWCFVENTLISTKSGNKFVQDITYDDDILVWNFDEGKLDYAKPVFIKKEQTSDSYWRVTDEDGKEINLVGSNGKSHRLYNKRTHLFEYPQDIPECKCEEIHESVKYYNILTEYHFNCYANGILTSKRYSNMLYPITDEMKYDKTVKHTNTCKRDQFGFLTDDEFEKLRLSEMEYSDEMCDEVRRFFALKK